MKLDMMHKKSQIHLKFRPKLERISRNIVILSKVFGSSMVATYHTKSDCPMFLGCDGSLCRLDFGSTLLKENLKAIFRNLLHNRN